MKKLILPILIIFPLTFGVLWFFTSGKGETIAATPVADAAPVVDEGVRFIAPIACDDPRTCVLQNHVDLALGEGISDPSCGNRTYDDHQGVDFRILDLPTMLRGVPVVAAAPGQVLRVRDGEYDGAWLAKGREVIGDRDCGNGIAIQHDDGFETLYCHLRRGSMRVTEGQQVEAGTPLADVGMSGRAEFPHVHMTITKDGKKLDPFSGRAIGEGCGEAKGSLWAGNVPAHWQPGAGPFMLKMGFSAEPVSLASIERSPALPTRESKAIVFYARGVALKSGDVQKIDLTGPEGFQPVGMEAKPLETDKAQAMRFVGRPAKDAPLPAGEYRGRYQIIRNGDVVLDYWQTTVLE